MFNSIYIKINLLFVLLSLVFIQGCTVGKLRTDEDVERQFSVKHSLPYQVAIYGRFSGGLKDGVDYRTGEPLVDVTLDPEKSSLISSGALAYRDISDPFATQSLSVGMGALSLLGSLGCVNCALNRTVFFIDAMQFPTEELARNEAVRQNHLAYQKLLEDYSFKYPINRPSSYFKGDKDGFQLFYRRVNTGDDVSQFKNYCYEDKGECFDNASFLQPFMDAYGKEMRILHVKGQYHIRFLDNRLMWVFVDAVSRGGLAYASKQFEHGFNPMEFFAEYAKHLPDNAYYFAVPIYTGLKTPVMFNQGQLMSWFDTGESR